MPIRDYKGLLNVGSLRGSLKGASTESRVLVGSTLDFDVVQEIACGPLVWAVTLIERI